MSAKHLYPLFYDFETIRDGWYNIYSEFENQYRGGFLFKTRREANLMGLTSDNLLYRIRVRVKHGKD